MVVHNNPFLKHVRGGKQYGNKIVLTRSISRCRNNKKRNHMKRKIKEKADIRSINECRPVILF